MAYEGAPAFEREFKRVAREWEVVSAEPDPTEVWVAEMVRMRGDQERLRAEGLWRSGGRTLLRALGLHHHEVMLCRGLAWLLTPDGWHGLGSTVLDGLLAHLGIEADGSAHATVVTEETRGKTRADIVIRFEGVTVLIEAKVWAGEQRKQADRLADGWAEEEPHLIFLTRDGLDPRTALVSSADWNALSWETLASIIAAASATKPNCEPGVLEYLRTLETYGGITA